MGKSRRFQKWQGYFLDDCACIYCANYRGAKRGCRLKKCCCLEEKREAAAYGRISRKRGFDIWDG